MDRTILRLAVPALGTLAIEPLYVVTDTAIVGHLGTTALGALAIAGQVLVLVIGCATSSPMGRRSGWRTIEEPAATARQPLVGVQALWLERADRRAARSHRRARGAYVARALGG